MTDVWRQRLSAIILLRCDAHPWLPLAFWAPVAAASMAAAMFAAAQPGAMQDLWQVRDWLSAWRDGARPYALFAGEIDYPPVAFLVLWPMSLTSDDTVAFWFLPVMIAMLAAGTWLLVGWLDEQLSLSVDWQVKAALVALVLAGGAARTSVWRGQTVGLALLLGALALRWGKTRPWAAGIALALCSFKPHVAAGIGLALVLLNGLPAVAVAAAVVGVLSLVFAATVGDSLVDITARYAGSLLALYDGPDRVPGMLSIRWVFGDLATSYATGTAVFLTFTTLALAMIVASALQRRDATTLAQAAVAAIVWSLLVLPHQLYHAVLAAPALWMMMWPEAQVLRRHSIRLAAVGAYVAFSVLDVPRTTRLLMEPSGDAPSLWGASYYFSPFRMVILLLLLLVVLVRRAWTGERRPA